MNHGEEVAEVLHIAKGTLGKKRGCRFSSLLLKASFLFTEVAGGSRELAAAGLVLPVDLFSPRAWAIFLLAMRGRPVFLGSGVGGAPAQGPRAPSAPSAHGLARR